MERDIGDIIDRFSIATLKNERIGTDENKKEFNAFKDAFNELKSKYMQYDWDSIFKLMYSINDAIWQCEAGLKSGFEKLKNPYYILDDNNKDILAKIGAMTIIIRNFNSLRVQFKNIINKLTNTGFMDIKKYHLSSKNN